MTTGVPRLPISLDPLMAEAKRRMRQRRLFVAAVVLAVAVAGTALTLRGPNSAGGATASGTLSNLAFRYPTNWKLVGWDCWIGPMPNMLLLTTARPTPTCGRSHRFPPRQRLARDGVAVWLEYPAPPMNVTTVSNPNARIDGQPARMTAPPLHGLGGTRRITCGAGAAPGRPLSARIQDPGSSGDGLLLPRGILRVGAFVCGPDYAKGDAAIHTLIASIRRRR